ncbi:MAG TPA: TIGR04076 family protein [Gemmatimonadetes bacterium]|nr:TIGR04076 family protein [Gemmatimonadota bacterium]HBV05333.1 TIGR04076 family protein [Gemmatimonadota bacterium]|tara:strand:+ start:25070 stop:25462 length:393 start_codon:yes stop_codon:yes gene_type:complete
MTCWPNQQQEIDLTVEESDEFLLYDLRVEVIAGDKPMVCNHAIGDYFELSGENLTLPSGQSFPIYPLAALLPLLPAKQRETHPYDWMTTDMEVACPDPLCGARFRITRTGQTVFRHADVTRVPLGDSTAG